MRCHVRPTTVLAVALCVTFAAGHARADVRLPGFFGDHMVFQQGQPIRIWGWGDEGESVTVTLGENSATARTSDAGRWEVALKAMPASTNPLTLTVQGANKVEVSDVLIGEVWLCSGQSNMEWTVRQSSNSAAEIAAANFPLIRHMKVARRPSTVPLDDLPAEWRRCAPDTAGDFTAVGYFMARELHRRLGVPVGLINSSWGGTRVEPWTPPEGFAQVEALAGIHQSVIGRTPGTSSYRARLTGHIAATEQWLQKAREAAESNTPLDPSPAYPAELTPFRSHQDPTMLYNGMIHALVGYSIRGAIWYQGESNHAEGMLYFEKKKALINGWRKLWGQGEFPFYYVQIAPFQYGNEAPAILAQFWEAQAAVEQVPNTGMVVINDIATLNDIHPPNKQDVGKRLALLALKNDYGKDVVARSPRFSSLDVLDGKLRVHFSETGGGLKTRDGKAPSHFEVIGQGSGGFQAATAEVDGDSVLLQSDAVKSPVAFRFAWHKLAEPNLTGGTGLPVGAVRGGKEPEFFDALPASRDYELVYELDLAKLGREIRYDVDRADSIGPFDRIGYLLELQTAAGRQEVFVSMRAFTDDVRQIGIPTAKSGGHFQQSVASMDVFSTVRGVRTGTGLKGNIEFWPNNYGTGNSAGVPGASGSLYDIGDQPSPPRDGYGCMQVHNTEARQTVFAINHWSQGAGADLGIGNSTGQTRDWTFTGSARASQKKRLRIYVRPEQ